MLATPLGLRPRRLTSGREGFIHRVLPLPRPPLLRLPKDLAPSRLHPAKVSWKPQAAESDDRLPRRHAGGFVRDGLGILSLIFIGCGMAQFILSGGRAAALFPGVLPVDATLMKEQLTSEAREQQLVDPLGSACTAATARTQPSEQKRRDKRILQGTSRNSLSVARSFGRICWRAFAASAHVLDMVSFPDAIPPTARSQPTSQSTDKAFPSVVSALESSPPLDGTVERQGAEPTELRSPGSHEAPTGTLPFVLGHVHGARAWGLQHLASESKATGTWVQTASIVRKADVLTLIGIMCLLSLAANIFMHVHAIRRALTPSYVHLERAATETPSVHPDPQLINRGIKYSLISSLGPDALPHVMGSSARDALAPSPTSPLYSTTSARASAFQESLIDRALKAALIKSLGVPFPNYLINLAENAEAVYDAASTTSSKDQVDEPMLPAQQPEAQMAGLPTWQVERAISNALIKSMGIPFPRDSYFHDDHSAEATLAAATPGDTNSFETQVIQTLAPDSSISPQGRLASAQIDASIKTSLIRCLGMPFPHNGMMLPFYSECVQDTVEAATPHKEIQDTTTHKASLLPTIAESADTWDLTAVPISGKSSLPLAAASAALAVPDEAHQQVDDSTAKPILEGYSLTAYPAGMSSSESPSSHFVTEDEDLTSGAAHEADGQEMAYECEMVAPFLSTAIFQQAMQSLASPMHDEDAPVGPDVVESGDLHHTSMDGAHDLYSCEPPTDMHIVCQLPSFKARTIPGAQDWDDILASAQGSSFLQGFLDIRTAVEASQAIHLCATLIVDPSDASASEAPGSYTGETSEAVAVSAFDASGDSSGQGSSFVQGFLELRSGVEASQMTNVTASLLVDSIGDSASPAMASATDALTESASGASDTSAGGGSSFVQGFLELKRAVSAAKLLHDSELAVGATDAPAFVEATVAGMLSLLDPVDVSDLHHLPNSKAGDSGDPGEDVTSTPAEVSSFVHGFVELRGAVDAASMTHSREAVVLKEALASESAAAPLEPVENAVPIPENAEESLRGDAGVSYQSSTAAASLDADMSPFVQGFLEMKAAVQEKKPGDQGGGLQDHVDDDSSGAFPQSAVAASPVAGHHIQCDNAKLKTDSASQAVEVEVVSGSETSTLLNGFLELKRAVDNTEASQMSPKSQELDAATDSDASSAGVLPGDEGRGDIIPSVPSYCMPGTAAMAIASVPITIADKIGDQGMDVVAQAQVAKGAAPEALPSDDAADLSASSSADCDSEDEALAPATTKRVSTLPLAEFGYYHQYESNITSSCSKEVIFLSQALDVDHLVGHDESSSLNDAVEVETETIAAVRDQSSILFQFSGSKGDDLVMIMPLDGNDVESLLMPDFDHFDTSS